MFSEILTILIFILNIIMWSPKFCLFHSISKGSWSRLKFMIFKKNCDPKIPFICCISSRFWYMCKLMFWKYKLFCFRNVQICFAVIIDITINPQCCLFTLSLTVSEISVKLCIFLYFFFKFKKKNEILEMFKIKKTKKCVLWTIDVIPNSIRFALSLTLSEISGN